VLLRLLTRRQLETRWIGAGLRCVPICDVGLCMDGELLVGSSMSGPGGRGESLRRSHGDAAGVEPGASPVDRTAVNVGTARGRSLFGPQPEGEKWG
jgi:hypothetical protein